MILAIFENNEGNTKNHFGKLDVFEFRLCPLARVMADWGPVQPLEPQHDDDTA